MELEIDLPAIPSSLRDSSPELIDVQHSRKRSRLEYDLKTSSDPALFSSDDHAPTAENYASERSKKKWRGTWWGEKVKDRASSTSNGEKRKFTRNFDSGVWMGSEGTDASLDDELLEELRSNDRPIVTLNIPTITGEQDIDSLENRAPRLDEVGGDREHRPQSSQLGKQQAHNASLHAAVEAIIDHCLEAGNESIDLSSMFLDDMPNESLRRLRSLTKHNTIQDIPPCQDAYSSIEPALNLYISNNSLSRVPSEVLNLTDLRVLSLRNNKLTAIPPAIANLPKLEHLNLSGNELPHLPYEIHRFFDRAEFLLIAHPNPFEEVASTDPTGSALGLSTTQPLLLLRGIPTYFHSDGSPAKDTRLCAPHRVPSLFELALQKTRSLPDLSGIQDWCTIAEGPASLSRPLALAQEATAYGERECTICSRSFIVPRVEWLEWWDTPSRGKLGPRKWGYSHYARSIPFLRQGCSWACVAEEESYQGEPGTITSI